jgi:hypothetical protein
MGVWHDAWFIYSHLHPIFTNRLLCGIGHAGGELMITHKRFDIETVVKRGKVLGYRVRSTHVYGCMQEAPIGWLIGKRHARTIEFQPNIYKTRLDAAKALEAGNHE